MKLRHLRYFVAVAEERHFRRAAQRLGVSQPPLSQQIKELEIMLGVALLERTNRSVTVTEDGEIFLRRARAILEGVEDTQKEMRALAQNGGGARIGYMSAAMATSLVPLLCRLREDHGLISLSMRQMSANSQLHAVASGALDLGFVDLDADRASVNIGDRFLLIKRAWRERLVAILPRDHRLAGAEVARIEELAQEPLIVLARNQLVGFYDHVIDLCTRSGIRPNIAIEAAELPEVMTLVAAGFGVSFAPERSSRPWKEQVTFLQLDIEQMTDVSVVVRSDFRPKVVDRILGTLPKVYGEA